MAYGFTPETDAERSTTAVQPDAFFPAVTAAECASLQNIDTSVDNAVLNNALFLSVLETNDSLQTWAEQLTSTGEEFTAKAGRAELYKNAVYSSTKAQILRDAISTDRTADAAEINDADIAANTANATRYIAIIQGRRAIGVHSV